MRACALLPAATGNIGKPGAGFYYLNGGGRKGLDGDYLAAPALRRQPAKSLSHMDLAATLEDPEGEPRPLLLEHQHRRLQPDQRRLHRALKREDLLTVVTDLFQTDTADFADYVLPAASFLEFDDIVSPYFNLTLSAQVKAVEPQGEALPNQEIFRRLARAMGYEEPELYEKRRGDPGRALPPGRRRRRICGVEGQGHRRAFPGAGAPVRRRALSHAQRQDRDRFGPRAEAMGLPRTPIPACRSAAGSGRLRLLSPASPWAMNTTYGNDPANRARLASSA